MLVVVVPGESKVLLTTDGKKKNESVLKTVMERNLAVGSLEEPMRVGVNSYFMMALVESSSTPNLGTRSTWEINCSNGVQVVGDGQFGFWQQETLCTA